MKRVSFDFDETLNTYKVQEFCKQLIKVPDIEVWIVTARVSDDYLDKHDLPDNWNRDLWNVVDINLELPREQVVFMNYSPKYTFFEKEENHDFLFHLEDDLYETQQMRKELSHLNLNVINHLEEIDWKKKIIKLIK